MSPRWLRLAWVAGALALAGCEAGPQPLPTGPSPQAPVTSAPTAPPPSPICTDQAAVDVGAPLVPAATPQEDGETDIAANDLQDPGTDAGSQEGC